MTMRKDRIGLLPLYLQLYDQVSAKRRPMIEQIYSETARTLRERGLDVVTAPICRLKPEFASAIRKFKKQEVDAIVTLHLAYSPSLESADVLARTKLPLIVLDTTPTYDFGPTQSPDEIMFNHGIHGVQDMCNLLLRNGKPFKIEAGHCRKSDVLDRVVGWVKSARMATVTRKARIGRIGRPFAGMGDFAVPAAALKNAIGVETVVSRPNVMRRLVNSIPITQIEAEMAADRRRFAVGKMSVEAHRRSVKVGLGVRRWIEEENLSGFTVNFRDVNDASGMNCVPFLEASKAMARGLGYAGEGDVLTASLVAALASVYPATTFTEMFCPDWKGNRIFVSHMGEVNPDLIAGKPKLVEMDYIYSKAQNPVKLVGCLRGGRAVFVNLAPCAGGLFRLILSPITMTSVKGKDKMADSVHGWFEPRMRIDKFLTEYGKAGGTHHAALVYGDVADEIVGFGEFMGWEVVTI